VFHGVAAADLADEDDVGRLPQGVLQCVLVAVRVDADLALVDDGLLVRMHELDGSSLVRMWSTLLVLRCSISEASEVD
jgi:hypothetical protein